MSSTASQASVTDALPFLKTSDDAVWDRAKRQRDAYYEAIDARLKSANNKATLVRNALTISGVDPVWQPVALAGLALAAALYY